MFGRRRTKDEAEVKEVAAKPLTVQEKLSLLETGEVLLKYPVGLLQPFSRQELARLKKRFVHLMPAEDTSRELRVPLAMVLQMPELRLQPFVPLVAQLVLRRETKVAARKNGVDGSQEVVSFSAFVTILAVFSVKQPHDIKRQVLFDIYDQDKKGCVTVDDFVRVVCAVSHSNTARHKVIRQGLEKRVAPFIKQTKGGVSGVLLSDFNELIADEEVINTMTIAY